MFSLFAEVRFWSYRNNVLIRDTDFGAFRFQDKKEISKHDVYGHGKESYAEGRGVPIRIPNSRPQRLRSRLRELEQVLQSQKLIWCKWRAEGCLQLMTSSGLIINIRTHLLTGAPLAVSFDRYLVGKTAEITDVAATQSHLILSHAENHLTLVYFVKIPSSTGMPEKLHKLETKVQTVELVGPSGRRLQRHVSGNLAGDMVLTWWQTSRHEVYPWAPTVKDRDRANVHLYTLTASHLDLFAYFRTESEPICVKFSTTRPHSLWALEQKVSRKGEVTVECSCFSVVKRQLVKKTVTSIPLQTHVSCHAFSPNEDRLVLGCIDGSVVLLDEGRSVTRTVRAAFIPTFLEWHNDGALLFAANDRGQFQCFDLALSCVRAQLLSEDVTPSNLLDLGAYFSSQPTLTKMQWSSKETVPFYGCKFLPNDSYLLLAFEGGPIAILSFVGGGGLMGDVHSSGITPDSLIRMYLTWNQIDRAVSMLLSLDWNRQGGECLAGLYHITNALFRSPLSPEKELQLETALGSFHAPLRPLNSATLEEFSDQVHDLTRRFFHQLIRYELYEKAFSLAIDLNDRDLFLDLLSCSRRLGDRKMSLAVKEQLQALNSEGSSCSCDGSSESEDEHLPPLPNINKPPLPDISRFGRLRESAFFQRSQPGFSIIPEEPSSPVAEVEKLSSLTSKPLLFDRPRALPVPSRSSMTDNKTTFTPTLSSTAPYIPSPATHFSSILGPSSSVTLTSPPPYIPPPISSPPKIPIQNSSFPPISSALLTSKPAKSTFSFSSPKPTNGPLFYQANPLSSHLYGAATRAFETKAGANISNTATKQKVKFSDTVTQIVVPDISDVGGGKSRRGKGVNPAQELADSLPLCLSNDYLKDFAKAKEEDEEMHGATIKVIHFGVV